MYNAAGQRGENSGSQGLSIIDGALMAHFVFESMGAWRARLLASHAEIRLQRLVAEGAEIAVGFGRLQAFKNVVSEANGALIEAQPDVAASSSAAPATLILFVVVSPPETLEKLS